MKKLIVFLSVLIASIGHGQIINTIAGIGGGGFSGDGNAAINAQLFFPDDVAMDAAGNIYFSDEQNNRIRKIDVNGIITTIAGSDSAGYSGDYGLAVNARLHGPMGICLDPNGTIYFTEFYNNCVRKIDLNGIITTYAGNGTQGYSGDGSYAWMAKLNHPRGIAISANGDVYISDTENGRVRFVNHNNQYIFTFAGNGTSAYSGDGGYSYNAGIAPRGLAFTSNGELLIADEVNNRIRKVGTNMIITTIAGNGVGDFSGDNGSAVNASLNLPTDICIAANGTIFISDKGNQRVRMVDPNGIITTYAGHGSSGPLGDGGPAIDACLHCPTGVIMDQAGDLFIADEFNNRIRKVAVTTGIAEENNSSVISFYPNPVSSTINIKLNPFRESSQMVITNSLGEIILVQNLSSENYSIDLTQLPAGIYFLQIISEGENVSSEKFMKE